MLDRLRTLRTSGDQGLTLIELLVVITILGVLAGIVVFSVAGVGDKGQSAACKTDTSTIQTAQEAFFSKNGSYATSVSALQTGGFLSNGSQWHATTTSGSTYVITEVGSTCGTAGATVDGTTNL